jgi:hypothetical protein
LDGPLAGLMETTMSTNDTSYGVAATSERELTDNAIDTFFRALLRPAALSQGDGLVEPQRGLTGAAGRNEALAWQHPSIGARRL